MLDRTPVIVESVEPLEGREGTVVTLRGSGFASHFRNNCVLIGGFGACARAEPDCSSTELKVRIGPIAKETTGDVHVWAGIGAELFKERVSFGELDLDFSEIALFRNGTPDAPAGVQFHLTQASPDTYAGHLEESAESQVELGGHERGSVIRIPFPHDLSFAKATTVDVCIVLKEPTLAIDFSATISNRDHESAIRAIAKSISIHAGLIGERVFSDVTRNSKTGELELYVTKPYLSKGTATVHFGA